MGVCVDVGVLVIVGVIVATIGVLDNVLTSVQLAISRLAKERSNKERFITISP